MIKKLYLLLLAGLFFIPSVSAAAGFDMYYLFVENIFGGIVWATIGFVILFIVLGMISRMSHTLLVMLLVLFVMTSLMGFVGQAATFLFFIGAAYYFAQGLLKWIYT